MTRAMGPTQKAVLGLLADSEGQWTTNSSWTWVSRAKTILILDSLIPRGYVEKDNETGVYSITYEGRMVLSRLYPQLHKPPIREG
jgi:DNA-binding IclR family transcriptional regulator